MTPYQRITAELKDWDFRQNNDGGAGVFSPNVGDVRKVIDSYAYLLAALKECHNQLETNDMNGQRVYQHLTNERRNMLSAAKLMAKQAIEGATK